MMETFCCYIVFLLINLLFVLICCKDLFSLAIRKESLDFLAYTHKRLLFKSKVMVMARGIEQASTED